LFILYINTICDSNTGGLVVTYADDTCLLFSGKSWETVKEKTIIGLNKVFQESNNKKLTLNIKKTNFMTFYMFFKH